MSAQPQIKETAFTPEGPQPLVREIAPGAAYPAHALGPLRAAVEAVQGSTQAPLAIPAQSALAVASLAVQGFADVETLGGPRPVSIYALTVARSGERKSACDAPLMEGLRQHEREQEKAQRDAMEAWRNAQALWAAERKRILDGAKNGKGEKRTAARADLEALGPEPAAPPCADRTVTEPTFEGLTRLFAHGQPALGIFSDEGGQFLGGHAMNSDNRQKTLAALNDLWQGNPIRRTRSGDGHATLFGRRLAVHLMVQPGVARAFMADPAAADTGFLPRFLMCEPPSAIGTRFAHNARGDDAAVTSFAARLRRVLDTPLPMDPETRELRPRILPLAPQARALLVGFSDAVEAAQAPGGDLAHITGTASKAAEQATRIAGVLTLWRDLDARDVQPGDMADAIELAQFYLSEASRLANAATISAEIDRAEALRRWLLEGWTEPDVLVRDVVRLGPNPLRESPKARAALAVLEKHGWIVALDAGTVVRGAARAEAWRIVKAARDVV
ncbi:MAG: YfjI family protein [Gemmobacter sp.]|nr:YfjI family protein [Gemmobacter sp.]